MKYIQFANFVEHKHMANAQKNVAENVPYFFHRFSMADASRNNRRTGSGLEIAECLAEEMRGTGRNEN